MPEITMPTFPVLGLPEGTKEAGKRVDFKKEQFELIIETHGYRLAWTRAANCPCDSVTENAKGHVDPNCDLCNGTGWYYFGHPGTLNIDLVGDLDSVQTAIVEENDAMVIKGILTSIQNRYNPWDKIGNWMSGTMQCTTRWQNKLGYYDKLTALDTEMVYSEVLVADGTRLTAARYLVTGVNQLRTTSTVYVADVDFKLEDGKIAWYPGVIPVADTRITAHYLCHPTWLVVEHPHTSRMTNVKFKKADPVTPQGDPTKLPVQAIVQYDFLPDQ